MLGNKVNFLTEILLRLGIISGSMELLNNILQSSQLGFGINLLDIVIALIVVFYAYEGYTLGFVLAFFDLVSFILSFIIALKFYAAFAHLLTVAFGLPVGFANAIGFFLTAFASEVVLNIL